MGRLKRMMQLTNAHYLLDLENIDKLQNKETVQYKAKIIPDTNFISSIF